jgi:hemolysin activation/secretion protein
LVALALSFPAYAANVPPSVESGRIPERFQEPVEPKSLPRTETIRLPSVEPFKESKLIKLTVARFEIIGSTVYQQESFTPFTSLLTGKEIPLSEVYALAGKITGLYGDDGYVLTRVIVPPQDLATKDAVVRLEVVEGYIDSVKWPEGLKESYRDLFSEYEQKILEEKPTNIKTIERCLLLASDLPGLRFSSIFEASKINSRASTLNVAVMKKTIDADATIDNRGSDGRGPWQGQTGMTLNNALGLHESFSLRYASAIPFPYEMQYVEGTYRQIINSEGLNFSFTGSYNKGSPGISDLQALDYNSEGTNFSAALSYPILRSRDQNLFVTGSMFFEDSHSIALDAPFTEDRLRGFRANAAYDNADTTGAINAAQFINQYINKPTFLS